MRRSISLVAFFACGLFITMEACNRSTVIKKSVVHNGDFMKVELYKKIDGRKLQDFTHEYDVTGLSKAEKDALAQRVIDSVEAAEKMNR